jgi:prophage tail gpP-like protein
MKFIINNKEFFHFSSYSISLKYNSIADTFSFSALSNILDKVLNYDKVEIFDDNNELLITGTILNDNFKISPNPEVENFAGYSKTGILEDCNISPNNYPLQKNNLNFNELVTDLLNPFNLNFIVDSSVTEQMNKVFKQTTAKITESIAAYINRLANQRNIALSHTAKGELLFIRPNISKLPTVASFNSNTENGVFNKSITFNGQSLHSEITLMPQASEGNEDGGQFTIKNPFCKEFRPMVKIQTSDTGFTSKEAARKALSAEIASIKVPIKTTQFIKPDSIVEIFIEEKMNEPALFFVEQTDISRNANSGEIYNLTCVLKDVYDLDNYNIKNPFK